MTIQHSTPDIIVGDGPPLVVLPGLGRGPVTKPLAYRNLAKVTQRSIYVINRPSGLPCGLTMRDLAARHAELLAERFDEPVDVFGCSTGGAIALQLAVDHPQCVRKLVIAAAASWLGQEGREKLRRYGEEVGRGRSGATVLASVLAPQKVRWLLIPLLWTMHQLHRKSIPTDMLATIDAEVGFDVTPQLGQIQSPTLLIAGALDLAFPLPLVEATAACIPHSKLIVYPKAGHLGTMINQRFGRDVADFLSST